MSLELVVTVGFLIMVVLIVSLLICANERERLLRVQENNYSKYYNKLLDLSHAAEQRQAEHIKKLKEELNQSQIIIAAYREELKK